MIMNAFRKLFRSAVGCALALVLACLSAETAVAAPAISFTDVAGRRVELDSLPKTFVVANYIANFLMVAGRTV